jgi:hypothetical protein
MTGPKAKANLTKRTKIRKARRAFRRTAFQVQAAWASEDKMEGVVGTTVVWTAATASQLVVDNTQEHPMT